MHCHRYFPSWPRSAKTGICSPRHARLGCRPVAAYSHGMSNGGMRDPSKAITQSLTPLLLLGNLFQVPSITLMGTPAHFSPSSCRPFHRQYRGPVERDSGATSRALAESARPGRADAHPLRGGPLSRPQEPIELSERDAHGLRNRASGATGHGRDGVPGHTAGPPLGRAPLWMVGFQPSRVGPGSG